MKTKGWGWLTAGVLALGLNGFYQDGGAAWAHRVVDRVAGETGTFADLASARFDRLEERISLVAARNETASCRLATSMARFQNQIARTQTGMSRFEAMSARQEAAVARVEAKRARIEDQMVHLEFASGISSDMFRPVVVRAIKVPVVCPRVRVNVPRVPVVKIPAPMVRVDLGNRPI